MAIVIPRRSRYKPRHIVEYVVDNVMRLRSNCDTIIHPNTPLQQRYKSRFTLMHTLQRGIIPLFRQGFDRKRSEKAHWIGSFQMALGHNMTEAAQLQEDGITWRCDFSRFTICEHKSKAPKRITVQREGNLLVLSYTWGGQAERTGILWGVYNRRRQQWVYGIENTRLTGQVMACAIPPEWREEPLEVLVGFGRDAEGRGKLRGTHHFTFAESVGLVTVRGTSQDTTSGGSSLLAFYIQWNGRTPWVELQDCEGIMLRVKVWYWVE